MVTLVVHLENRLLRKIVLYICIMFYKDIEKLTSPQFKRLTGVKRDIFTQMLIVLDEAKVALRKHPNRGVSAKLSNADKLLLLLMY